MEYIVGTRENDIIYFSPENVCKVDKNNWKESKLKNFDEIKELKILKMNKDGTSSLKKTFVEKKFEEEIDTLKEENKQLKDQLEYYKSLSELI